MRELTTRLRERGWRITAQRRVIADVLDGPHVHFTAEQIHSRARQLLPEVSMATVYNTLNELVSMGEVQELLHSDGRKRYDPNADGEHQHLVCEGCGTMIDVLLDAEPTLTEDELHGFSITAVDVTFRGLCPDCSR